MKVSVIFEDDTVVVDDVARNDINLQDTDPNWHALQWLEDRGWIEVKHGDRIWLSDISSVQTFIDMHAAAVEPIPESEPTNPVPASITPRQCRLLLLQQGLLSQVEAMIAQSTDDVKITWEYALEFRRNDPLLTQFAANLKPPLTDAQLDQFFIAAAQL